MADEPQPPPPVAPPSGPAPAGPVIVHSEPWWSDPVTLLLLLMLAEQLQDMLSSTEPLTPRSVAKVILNVLITFVRNRRNTVVQ